MTYRLLKDELLGAGGGVGASIRGRKGKERESERKEERPYMSASFRVKQSRVETGALVSRAHLLS